MTDLRDPFEDLVANVPSYVVPDARAAWTAGARRRTRRRAGAAALAVVAVALVAGMLTLLPRAAEVAPADGGEGVSGYPSRIDDPWWTRDLPDRSGPLAGLIEAEDGDWSAVSASGHLWHLPQEDRVTGYPVAISPDGSRVAYLRDHDTFIVRDVVRGTTTTAQEVGDGLFNAEIESHDRDNDYAVASQAPAFWSPDSATFFVLGSPTAQTRGRNGALLIGADGSVSYVRSPRSAKAGGGVWPAGWTPGGNLVWLDADFPRERPRWARVVETTVSGAVVGVTDLEVPDRLGGLSQWSGSVSPDGARLALSSEYPMRTFVLSLGTGQVVETALGGNDGLCPVSWSDDGIRTTSADDTGAAVVDDEGRTVIGIDPGLEVQCSTWAVEALSGTRHEGVAGLVFGASTSWASWHWRELGLGLLAGVVGVALLVVRRRRVSAR